MADLDDYQTTTTTNSASSRRTDYTYARSSSYLPDFMACKEIENIKPNLKRNAMRRHRRDPTANGCGNFLSRLLSGKSSNSFASDDMSDSSSRDSLGSSSCYSSSLCYETDDRRQTSRQTCLSKTENYSGEYNARIDNLDNSLCQSTLNSCGRSGMRSDQITAANNNSSHGILNSLATARKQGISSHSVSFNLPDYPGKTPDQKWYTVAKLCRLLSVLLFICSALALGWIIMMPAHGVGHLTNKSRGLYDSMVQQYHRSAASFNKKDWFSTAKDPLEFKRRRYVHQEVRSGLRSDTGCRCEQQIYNLKTEFQQALNDLESSITYVGDMRIQPDVKHAVQLAVQEALEKYDNDRTNLLDYAHEYMGGQVLKSQSSSGHSNCKYFFNMFTCERNPSVIIKSGVMPGRCFPIEGSRGHVVIRLTRPIHPTAFTYEHIDRKISASNESAPRDMSVYGWLEPSEMDYPLSLGRFVFDWNQTKIRTFKLDIAANVTVQYFKFKFQSNWGNSKFTCVYRMRIHGNL